MKSLISFVFVLIAITISACGFTGPDSAATADTIYFGGDIVTVNDAQPSVEALAVKEGKILAVGTSDAVAKAHKGPSTTMVDLGGKTLLPGFLDPHSHYINSITVANQVNVFAPPAGPGKDVAAIVAELKNFAMSTKFLPAKSSRPMATTKTPCPRAPL